MWVTFVNRLLAERGYRRYLQLGCAADSGFAHVNARLKVGVDPISGGTLPITHETFFRMQHNKRFDLIFVHDGSPKDVQAAFSMLLPGGVVVANAKAPRIIAAPPALVRPAARSAPAARPVTAARPKSDAAPSEADARCVVYSAVFGGYDALPTDGRIVIVDDKRAPKNLSPRMRSRWCKMHPHILFPNAEYSVWLDASIVPTSLQRARSLIKSAEAKDVALMTHPWRNCVYQEAIACLRGVKCDGEPILEQAGSYLSKGLKQRSGLYATGILVRKHTDMTKAMSERWWSELLRWSSRDQISLPFILKELKDVKIATTPPLLWQPNSGFTLQRHKGKDNVWRKQVPTALQGKLKEFLAKLQHAEAS